MTVTESGTYEVTVTKDGLSNTAETMVTVNNSATADFSFVQGSSSDILNVDFTNASTNADSYSWNFGDGTALNTEVNPTHSYATFQSYTVELTAISTACENDMASKTVVVTGLEVDDLLSSQLEVFPNPTKGAFTLNLNAISNAKDIQVEVMDLTGRVVYTKQLNDLNNQSINLSSLSPNLYFVKVQIDGKVGVKRLMIQK